VYFSTILLRANYAAFVMGSHASRMTNFIPLLIDVVREKIKSFCSTQQLMSKGIKLVILDECDHMTNAA
jgi:DNA polymerase III delta prime subunit